MSSDQSIQSASPPGAGNISALVLAGGRARRMGGDDKGLVRLAGRAMVQWVSESLAAQCAEVRINANRNREEYTALTGFEVVSDRVEDFAGPLAGMAAGLATCATPWMVCVPCDSPLLRPDLVSRLAGAASQAARPLAVAHDGERMQPVFVLLARDLLASMETFLHQGGRKIDTWYAQHDPALAAFADGGDMFLNVNTPEQRDDLERRLLAASAAGSVS